MVRLSSIAALLPNLCLSLCLTLDKRDNVLSHAVQYRGNGLNKRVNGTWNGTCSGNTLTTSGDTSTTSGDTLTTSGTDPTKVPITGVVRTYNWIVSRGWIMADGFNKSAILVNNQFPGPKLEANWGDTFQITVTNEITGPEEGTLLHWHGLLHKGSPWMDGVPAIDSCPIAPGKSFTYTFLADQYGTSWWHSHYSAQYVDGLLGPMIIHGPTSAPYDIDLGPVFLSTYYHPDYHPLLQATVGVPRSTVYSDNNIINFQQHYDCTKVAGGQACNLPTPLSTFSFTSGKTYLIRLINTSPQGIQHFSIDGHQITIIANDYVPVVPYNVTYVTLGEAQRVDILVKATGSSTGAYYMRSNVSTVCNPANQPYGLGAIYYENANTSLLPTSEPTPYNINTCANEPLGLAVPSYAIAPPPSPATTEAITIVLKPNATGHVLFYMNGESYRGDYNQPTLLLTKAGNESYPYSPEWNYENFGTNSSVRIVLYNTSPLAHPMHLHGHNFFVLNEGHGTWDGTIINPSNPQRRDVQLLQNGTATDPGYVVLEWNQDNPGIWPLHCHISWHISNGLFVQVVERPSDIQKLSFPPSLVQTCVDWWQFTDHDTVDQIDSGV